MQKYVKNIQKMQCIEKIAQKLKNMLKTCQKNMPKIWNKKAKKFQKYAEIMQQLARNIKTNAENMQ